MKKWITGIILSCTFLVLTGCGFFSNGNQIQYEGNTYVLVEFPQDIFTSGFGMAGDFVTDETYSIQGAQFDMIHNSGDLFCIKNQVKEASAYYKDDANYQWTISIMAEDYGDDEIRPIEITEEELAYIYTLEDMEKDLAIFFDEIEQQVTLIKTSKDGIAYGSMELVLYKGKWYWRSAVIDDSREKDDTWPEYVYPMPESFQDKIILDK